jgi:hypothetical protein
MRANFARDGYVFLPGLVPRDAVDRAHAQVCIDMYMDMYRYVMGGPPWGRRKAMQMPGSIF